MRALSILICVSILSCLSFVASGASATGATPVYRPAPFYAIEAKRDGIEGYVIVRFTINTDGRTTDIHVVESVPEGVFDKAAVRAVTLWEYKAALFDGEPQASSTQVLLEFSLKN